MTNLSGLESLQWQGPKILNLLPDNVANAKSFTAYNNALNKVNIDKYPCKLCKN